jgi:eukaryotic-like serine/threonine-protein kinase
MGVVWRAHDNLLDREVAVKEVVISALISEDERRNAYQRTLREARTAARLSHRGVVAIYDVVEEDGRPWIIMELVPSQSLDQVLTVETRIPAARAGRIGQQLLSALAAAHVAGVLHRDVKPSNVLIAKSKSGEGWEERAVLTDFGIAQFEGDPRLTQTGMVMGSPGFTAPERIRGNDASPASDLWSLGATIYAAVEGRGPYENRGGAITTMSAIINEDAPVAPHAGLLAPVIASLLRRDPRTRPSASYAARMFAQALQQMSDSGEERPPAKLRPQTAPSSYIPAPAAPVVSAAVPSADRGEAKKAAAEESAETSEPAQSPEAAEQSQEAPAAENAEQSDKAQQAEEADAAEQESAPEAAAEATPEAESAPKADPVPEAAKPAAEEAKPASEPAPAAKTPAPAPGTPSADVPAAKPKASDTVIPLKGADTVIPRTGAGYRPTEVAVPVARAVSPESTETPAKPKPTFTAAKPAPRPGPSFSASAGPAARPMSPASPAGPAQTGRPTPPRVYDPVLPVPSPPTQRPAQGQQHGQQYSQQLGQQHLPGTTFRTSSASAGAGLGAGVGAVGGANAAAGARYPAPQPAPNPSRLYPPGTSGGPGNRRNRPLLWIALGAIIAAAAAAGVVIALNGTSNANGAAGSAGATDTSTTSVPTMVDTPTTFPAVDALNDPTTALPGTGWTLQTVTQAEAGSVAAGYQIDIPPGWNPQQSGTETSFTGPGGLLVEVDLTQQTTSNMLSAETQVMHEAQPKSPGFKQQSLQAVSVRQTEGSVSTYTWTPNGSPEQQVNDIFFEQNTPNGVQDYAILISSPTSTFKSSLATFDKMLGTFQTDPTTAS